MQLGKYNAATQGTGYDIDIKALQFGRNPDVVPVGGNAAADRIVRITNPYFEFVYKNSADAANREVIGMRLGFEGISGYLGTQIRSLSGSVKADITSGASVIAFDSGTGTKRSDGTAAGTVNPVLLSSVGEFKLGNAEGATRDFFIGVQSQEVAYPTVSGVPTPSAAAGSAAPWVICLPISCVPRLRSSGNSNKDSNHATFRIAHSLGRVGNLCFRRTSNPCHDGVE